MSSQHDRIIDPANTRDIAASIMADVFTHQGCPTLLFDGGEYWLWELRTGCYTVASPLTIQNAIYTWLQDAKKIVEYGRGEARSQMVLPVCPSKALVENVLHALRPMIHSEARPPCWLCDDAKLPPATELIVARNGIFRPGASGLIRVGEATPALYATNALNYPIDLQAAEPFTWLAFLMDLWPNDPDSRQLLQWWFGYCLTADTAQQKALLLIGPKRSGKGTIARILTALIGAANVSGPTLSGLASHFGMWSLIGKLVAIISDARLSGRADQATIVELLLAITGEDLLDIDRKNLPPLTRRLLARFMILTNEMPRLNDSSGALANRFLILTLNKSFLGREDTKLTAKLLEELPGILLWAIDGLVRLRARGSFIMPASSREMLAEMEDLGSPIGAFVRDWCRTGPACRVPCKDLFDAFVLWAREQGNHRPGPANLFARDLRAVLSNVRTIQAREGEERVRTFSGIDLTAAADFTLTTERAKQHDRERHHRPPAEEPSWM